MDTPAPQRGRSGWWPRRRRIPGAAVIVVVGPGQAASLDACLSSVPDGVATVVAPWGGVALPQPPGGIVTVAVSRTANQARNLAAQSADGAVLLIEAHERLTPAAEAALASPPESGQPMIAGPVHRLSSYLWGPGATPAFPPDHGRFPQAVLPSTTSAARADAKAFVVPEGGDGAAWGVPFGTTPAVAAELDSFVGVVRAGIDARAEWLAGFLTDTLPTFVDDLENAVDTAPLGAVLASLADPGDAFAAGVMRQLPAEQRIRAWLAARGRFDELVRLTATRWYAEGQAPTRITDGHVVLDLGVPEVPIAVASLPVSAEVFLARAWSEGGGLRFGLYAALRWVDFDTHPPTISATWVSAAGERVPAEVAVRPDPAASRHFRQWFQSHDAGAFVVTLAESLPAGTWHLDVEVTAGGFSAKGVVGGREPRGSAGILDRLASTVGTPRWDPRRGLTVAGLSAASASTPLGRATAIALSLEGDRLTMVATHPRPDTTLSLRAGEWQVPGTARSVGADVVEVVFELAHDPWRMGIRPLPSATWHVGYQSGRESGEVGIEPALAMGTPRDLLGGHHRVRIARGLRDQLLIATAAPLTDDELGPVRQQRLRTAYAQTRVPVDPELVLFTSYAGTAATDSPRAIFEELRGRGTVKRLLWVVADHSVPAPEGSEPVLRLSEAWFDALARAGTIVTNIEMERWFRRRPGQRVVQTFHGYPSKSMGKQLWQAKNMSPSRIDRMLDQTSRQWSVLLTPTPEMDRHYREQYDYAGEIINRGYPRDDVLTGLPDELAGRRAAARERLGIGRDRTVVLYAPTWRDDQATNFRAAAWVNHLDLERASAALGDGYLFLVRGHRFQKPPVGAARQRLWDVTSYPEVNDLILACDAAVVDYSSIRFDVALAGRPQVFLVPDLETYAGDGRGFLYPFTDSAPGPLVRSTDEVVAELADLDGLSGRWAAELAAFRKRFLADQDGRSARRVVDWLLD